MRIRYKVVNLQRESCFARSKYSLKYKKGEIVKADIKTHGLMVFKDYASAAEFKENKLYEHCAYILEVQPFGRAKKVAKIAQFIGEDDLNHYYEHRRVNIMRPPPGTLCYHAVEVLT